MRLVIFTDTNTVGTTRLIRGTLRATRDSAEHRVVGIVTARPEAFSPASGLATARSWSLRAIVAASNAGVPWRSVWDSRIDLVGTARRHGVPLLVPPSGDPNAPEFIGDRLGRLRPDVALSFYCRRRFGRRLRAAFAHAVNYHDGLLPDYRGAMATSFSIYAGASRSGWTFHHMTARIDRGPILLQDALPIDERTNLERLSRAKSRQAAAAIPRLLELVAAGDPGRPQTGGGSYYSFDDWRALTHLSEPEHATAAQIERRIRAFGIVYLTLDGAVHPATRLRPARAGERLAFRTADDTRLRPDRFRGLPERIYRLATRDPRLAL